MSTRLQAVPDEPLPAWGRLIRWHREAAGLTIREAARKGGLSDSFWGQVERGTQTRQGTAVPFVPSVGSLLHIGRTLRLTDADTDALLDAAGHPPLPSPPGRGATAGTVDTSGLARGDVRMLNALADRLRVGPVPR